MLENIVFIELKRRAFEIFYHKENKECDFLIRKNGVIAGAIQVCLNLEDEKTRKREYEGLLEALECYSLREGYILTEREEETKEIEYKMISYKVITKPVWKWLYHVPKVR